MAKTACTTLQINSSTISILIGSSDLTSNYDLPITHFDKILANCIRVDEQGTLLSRKTTTMEPPRKQDFSHDHDESSELSDTELRVRALESLLVEKGYVDPLALNEIIDTYENRIGPRNGARVVARAWVDPVYREWLLRDATEAIGSLGYSGAEGDHMVVVENTANRHNMIVCTLCSCYPWPVLGLPPVWYKSSAYRARAVIDPRSILAEFGVTLPADIELRVWDSTAEVRYLVLPLRPIGTDDWEESRLAALVTRDSMIGTGLPLDPGGLPQ